MCSFHEEAHKTASQALEGTNKAWGSEPSEGKYYKWIMLCMLLNGFWKGLDSKLCKDHMPYSWEGFETLINMYEFMWKIILRVWLEWVALLFLVYCKHYCIKNCQNQSPPNILNKLHNWYKMEATDDGQNKYITFVWECGLTHFDMYLYPDTFWDYLLLERHVSLITILLFIKLMRSYQAHLKSIIFLFYFFSIILLYFLPHRLILHPYVPSTDRQRN